MRAWMRVVRMLGLLAGTVVAVNAEEAKLVVSVDGEEQTVVVQKKATITLRGPMLDGIKKGDSIEMELVDMKGKKTLRKATVTREVEPPKKGKGGRGGKQRNRKKDGEGGGGDAGGAGAGLDGDMM
jgi:uncharacterized membrane protein YgcG